MYGIIALLILLIFLIIFYKWCRNRKSLFYKVLLLIGVTPFICDLIFSIISAKAGFTLFDFTPIYDLQHVLAHIVSLLSYIHISWNCINNSYYESNKIKAR